MSRTPIRPGEIGEVSWEERSPGSIRGRARTKLADGSQKRLSSTGSDRELIVEDLKEQARALVYRRHEWDAETHFEKCVDSFLEKKRKQIREQSFKNYESVARNMIYPRIGTISVGSLTASRIGEFMDKLEEDGFSASHRKKTLYLIRGGFKRAVRLGCVTVNAAREEDTPREAKKRKKGTVLSQQQVASVREAVLRWTHVPRRSGPPRGRVLELFVEIALATGLRIGEVLALRLRDIDLNSVPATISVTGTLVYKEDEDGVGRLCRQDITKGEEQPRKLRLPAFGRTAVVAAIALMEKRGRDSTILQARGGGYVAPANLRRSLRAALLLSKEELADVMVDIEEITPHTFRRTVLTAIKKLSGDVELARAQGGHKDSSVTTKHYIVEEELLIVEGVAPFIEEAFGEGVAA